jgi:hypothetical protein
MQTTDLIVYTVVAFFVGFFVAALFIRLIIFLNRRADEEHGLSEDHYPEARRSLHYISQEIAGILAALIIIAGFMAAIIVVLIVRR